MATKKISELTELSAITSSTLLPVVEGGATKRISWGNILKSGLPGPVVGRGANTATYIEALTDMAAGDLWIVTEAGTIDGIAYTAGDMALYGGAAWYRIDNDAEQKITGPGSAVDGRIAVFDGTSGKIAKDGGYTIADVIATTGLITAYLTGTYDRGYAQGLGNVTGLSLPLSASSVYEIEIMLRCGTDSDTNGIKTAIGYSGTATIAASGFGPVSTTGFTNANWLISAFSTVGTLLLTIASSSGGVLMKGIVTTTTAGDLTAQIQKLGGVGTAHAYAGSYIRARKVA